MALFRVSTSVGLVLILATISSSVTADDVQNLQYFGNIAKQVQQLAARFGPMNGSMDMSSLLPQMSSLTDAAATLVERYNNLPDDAKLNVGGDCLKHMGMFVAGLVNTEDWALRMVDAAGKPPSGVLNGNFLWIGSYDECVAAQAVVYGDPVNKTDPQSYPYTGRYCTVAVPLSAIYPSPITAGQSLKSAVCVPNSCSAEDIRSLVSAGMHLLPVNATKLPKISVTCQLENLEYDDRAIAAIVVFSILAFVMVISTLYDVAVIQPRTTTPPKVKADTEDKARLSSVAVVNGGFSSQEQITPTEIRLEEKEEQSNGTVHQASTKEHSEKGGDTEKGDMRENAVSQHQASRNAPPPQPTTLEKVLLSFSVYTNGAKILNTSQPAGTLSAVNGIRFLSMTWVILGHSFGDLLSTADNTLPLYAKLLDRFSFQAVANATVSVDSFFVIGGVLLAYLTLKEFKKVKSIRRFNWPMFYFHRFWRLTPPMMLFMLLSVSLMPYLGKGPGWIQESEECRDSWWRNLLYIQNLFHDNKFCIPVTWYIAIDMQLFIISPLLLIPLYYSKIIGSFVCLLFILACMLCNGLITVAHDYAANVIWVTQTTDIMDILYTKPWNRSGPYVVGIFTGFILYRTKCKVRMSKLMTLAGWAVATCIAMSVLYGLYEEDGNYLDQSKSTTVRALYNATSRTAWGVAVAWVIFACATKHGGFVNTLLSWKAFVPLSRLTYIAYLCHLTVLQFYAGSRQSLVHIDDLQIAYRLLGHLCVTYAVSFVLSLGLEAPMMGLEKALFGRAKNS